MTSGVVKLLTFIIFATVLWFLVTDIKEHGSFHASKTRRFLLDSGALHFGEIAWSNFRTYSQEGYRWCQKNVPVYMTKAREISAPFLSYALDWLTYILQQLLIKIQVMYDYFLEKKPLIEQWLNQYIPGLTESASTWFWQAGAFLLKMVELLLEYVSRAVDWLMENVFVGSLSPENLRQYTTDALNTTSQLAFQTLTWLNDKFITVITASSH